MSHRVIMKIKQEIYIKHLRKYLACNKHSVNIVCYYFQFFSQYMSHNLFLKKKACSPLSPYTFYWATDVYLVSSLAILILKVTHLWNLLIGRVPHTEQVHNKCCWEELTNCHCPNCSWVLFIVFLCASPTPAEKIEPERRWI